MALNRYKEHLVVFLEDEPYRDILNGVKDSLNVDAYVLDVKEPCGGCQKVFDELKDNLSLLEKFKSQYVLLLMDFDDKYADLEGSFEYRRKRLDEIVPDTYKDRVFILGVNHKEVEDLKHFLKKSNSEEIGKLLIEDCPKGDLSLWKNTHLECNLPEIERMRAQGIFKWLFK